MPPTARGYEHARAHGARQERIVRRAETQGRTRTRTRAKAQAKVWAEMWALARASAPPDVWAVVWAVVQAQAEAQVEVSARAEVSARERAEALVRVLALAVVRLVDEGETSLERAKALLASAENESGRRFLPSETILPRPYEPTYAELLADLKIMVIIDSIEPYYRHRLARVLPHSEHRWLMQVIAPVTRLPPELLHSIFSTTIDDASNTPLVLMLVCKRWYNIVTGVWASFKLGTRTTRDAVTSKLERGPRLLDIVVDTEIDRGDLAPAEGAYEAIFAAIEATSRWQSFVVETFPGQADLPADLVNRGLQRCSNATMSRLKTFRVKSACEVSPLLDHLLLILGTTASAELTTVEINSANVISFLLPESPTFRHHIFHHRIFHSVKVLFLDISGTHDPVDLLPHLHQLETLTASHLSLPIYADDINLPFVNTLRHLKLRAVSIQWMNDRTFNVLESCTIKFPLHDRKTPIFRTTLPNCKHLTFQGDPLHILDGVSAHKLIHLSVTSSCSFTERGGWQLGRFSSQVLGESRLAPRILHIGIVATSQAWMNALTLMPHLEELVIGNARPSSLRAKVLQYLIARPVHANNTGSTYTPEEWDAPLCPSLRRFGLKYRRWLRPNEHFDLIPDLVSIILSRKRSNCPLGSFWVWMRSDQMDPLELIEERGMMSRAGFERLAYESGVRKENMLGFVASGLVWITPGESS